MLETTEVVLCACGCGKSVPQHSAAKNQKYYHGHRPKEGTEKKIKAPRGLKSATGPEQIAAYFDAHVEQLRTNGNKLKSDAQDLLAQARHKMALAKEIDEQITQLTTVKQQTQDALSRVFKSRI